MKKRLAALFLALSLTAGLMIVPASAAATTSEADMIQVVNTLGIMLGDDKGNMNLDSIVTRAEFTTMAIKATPGGDRVGRASASPYPDVPYSHWAAGFVEAGVAAGYISGYTDGTFRPASQITLAEGVTIVLKVLGYTAADFSGVYPSGQMSLCHSLKLDEGLTVSDPSALLSRRNAMVLFYNMLTAPTKSGAIHLTTLGHSVNSAGEVDLVALINNTMKGPVTATGDWQKSLPFELSGAKVYQGQRTISPNAINEYDVVYYSDKTNTLWVYNDRISGTIQSIDPNESSPTSIKLAGTVYQLDSSAATYAVSSLGSFKLGDKVTLLLGRNGGVADIVATTTVSAGGERTGVITALGQENYQDNKGSYMADTVTILATDGNTYQYEWPIAHLSVGDLVRMKVETDGNISLTRPAIANSPAGTFSSDGSTYGRFSLAADVKILDSAKECGAMRVYASRLADVSLKSGAVRYYELNQSGEIVSMILNDVTGDLQQYGIVTGVESLGALSEMYMMNLGGRSITYTTSTQTFPVSRHDAVRVESNASGNESMLSINKINPLKSFAVDRISGNNAYNASNQRYIMSEDVLVYVRNEQEYSLSSLEKIQDGDFVITAFYDKAQSEGGRVRVIVAKVQNRMD